MTNIEPFQLSRNITSEIKLLRTAVQSISETHRVQLHIPSSTSVSFSQAHTRKRKKAKVKSVLQRPGVTAPAPELLDVEYLFSSRPQMYTKLAFDQSRESMVIVEGPQG